MLVRTFKVTPILLILLIAPPAHGYESELSDLSASIVETMNSSGKKTAAVVDFTDLQGNVTELGRFLAEEISVTLASSGEQIEIVDRTHLKSLLEEHKLSASGLIDPATARKLGQIAGVDVLITGSLTPFGDTVRVAAKVLDTETAKIFGAATTSISKTAAIADLLGRGISSAPSKSRSFSSSSPAKGSSGLKGEAGDIVFEIRECRISGQSLRCNLAITNVGEDTRFHIYGKERGGGDYTRIIDDQGVVNYSATADLGGTGSRDGHLISGVPISASVKFDDMSEDVRLLQVLEIKFESDGCRRCGVQIRNVPVTR